MAGVPEPQASGTWYTQVSGSELRQCDILPNCPTFTPRSDSDVAQVRENSEVLFSVRFRDLIVMSQTCDLIETSPTEEEWSIDVVVCRVVSLTEAVDANPFLNSETGKEFCRRGWMTRSIMIPESDCDGWRRTEPSIVLFGQTSILPLGLLRQVARGIPNRPRVVSPYRESISQAFGKYFMRVALESEIAEFDIERDEAGIFTLLSGMSKDERKQVARRLEANRGE